MSIQTQTTQKLHLLPKSVIHRLPNRHLVALTKRPAFTLVEALIAVTMTLVIMLALAQGFKQVSNDISEGRARLTLSDQLRGVSELLRNDLAGMTVVCDPQTKETKNGYFLYYEGPIADHHPVTAPMNNLLPGGTTEENLSSSRFGDFDDYLAFTAKAKGDWFKGRVPLALVKGAAGGGYAATLADWTQTVVVASEYAEIAWFMMPKLQPLPSGGTNPDYIYQTNADLRAPIVDTEAQIDAAEATAPPFAAGSLPTGNGVPDQMSLCRRVLLILPQLNNGTNLYNGGTGSNEVKLQASPLTATLGEHLTLRAAYQRCDLSVRRAPGAVNSYQPIIANSLDDLANPMNRFAHIVLPGNVIGAGANDTSMPILSLTGPIPLQQFAVYGNLSLAARSGGTYPEVGFINPQFMKRRFDATGAVEFAEDNELGGTVEVLTNEEVVATNCIAFDLKGFDPTARMLFNVGVDGTLGTPDDVEVSPSDPGYAESVRTINGTPALLPNYTSRLGTFVDVGWARKNYQPIGSNTQVTMSGISNASVQVIRESLLAGFAVGATTLSEGLLKSGRVVLTGGGTPLIYQPCFDSYTTAFERDGFRQVDKGSNTGTIFQNGLNSLSGTANTAPGTLVSDLASNGLDDDGNGLIDDFAEQDSSPPILSAMPAVQALIRVEDSKAGVIQQIAVTHDLATP